MKAGEEIVGGRNKQHSRKIHKEGTEEHTWRGQGRKERKTKGGG